MGVRMPKKKKSRRQYTKGFRAEAVALVRDTGKPVAEVAKDIDVTASSLFAWVRQAKVDEGHLDGATTDEKQELTALRKEVRALRMERDFLKKTAAYFAKAQK